MPVERACLALSSRSLAQKVSFSGLTFTLPDHLLLKWPGQCLRTSEAKRHHALSFLWKCLVRDRLIGGWLPADYRYCNRCQNALPTDPKYWEHRAAQEMFEESLESQHVADRRRHLLQKGFFVGTAWLQPQFRRPLNGDPICPACALDVICPTSWFLCGSGWTKYRRGIRS